MTAFLYFLFFCLFIVLCFIALWTAVLLKYALQINLTWLRRINKSSNKDFTCFLKAFWSKLLQLICPTLKGSTSVGRIHLRWPLSGANAIFSPLLHITATVTKLWWWLENVVLQRNSSGYSWKMHECRLHMDAPLSWVSENMTVTNKGLICHDHDKEEEFLNECVGVVHAYVCRLHTHWGWPQCFRLNPLPLPNCRCTIFCDPFQSSVEKLSLFLFFLLRVKLLIISFHLSHMSLK